MPTVRAARCSTDAFSRISPRRSATVVACTWWERSDLPLRIRTKCARRFRCAWPRGGKSDELEAPLGEHDLSVRDRLSRWQGAPLSLPERGRRLARRESRGGEGVPVF